MLSEPSLATDEIRLESKLQSCLSSNMAENTLTSDSFLTTTKEQELINETEDMQTDDLTKEEMDSLLSEEKNDFEEDIQSAQVPRQNTSYEHRFKQPKERPSTWSHQQNGSGRKRHRDQHKSAKTSTGVKRSRQDEELNSIQEKKNSSNNSIGFLENHLERGTCPKIYRAGKHYARRRF